MKVLVTGGCGYIGSHTCLALQAAGMEPVVVDNLCNSKAGVLARIAAISGREPRFYQGDIRDPALLDSIFAEQQIDAVIHFAALKAVGESTRIPLAYYENNLSGTLVLLQAIRAQVDVPLVAAGGICDGRGMAAAFALGAEAVQMGTRFVSCAESPVHANYKNAIVDAGVTGTWMLNTKASPCIRALKSQRTQAIHEAGLMPADSFAGIQRVYFDGDMEAAPALAGQTAGLIDSIKTAQQIIEETVAEFFAISQRMGALAAARSFG